MGVGETTVTVAVGVNVGVGGVIVPVGVEVAVYTAPEVGTSRSAYPKIDRALVDIIVRELIGTRATIGL